MTTTVCPVCSTTPEGGTVTLWTDRGEEVFCTGCWSPPDPPVPAVHDHAGLEGYDPAVVALADRLLDTADWLSVEAESRRSTATTREDWVAVEQLANAGNAVYSAQCWVLRVERERLSRRSG